MFNIGIKKEYKKFKKQTIENILTLNIEIKKQQKAIELLEFKIHNPQIFKKGQKVKNYVIMEVKIDIVNDIIARQYKVFDSNELRTTYLLEENLIKITDAKKKS